MMFPEFKVAYIPVPKAACTSIKTALLPLAGETVDLNFNVHKTNRFDVRPFSKCWEITPDWFVFTVVRHPVERALSAWRNKCHPKGTNLTHHMRKMGFRSGENLESFVETLSKWPARSMDEHVMPQSELLVHTRDWPVQVFKFESLRSDWKTIVDEIRSRGGSIPTELSLRGASVRKEENSLHVIEQLNHIYKEDFVKFCYQ
jgi:hypothetical protein